MDIATKSCDVCGRQNLAANDWLVAIVRPEYEGILFVPAEAAASSRNPDFIYEDICGQECGHKRLSRWFDELATTQESEAA
jgi:hypothetical protein